MYKKVNYVQAHFHFCYHRIHPVCKWIINKPKNKVYNDFFQNTLDKMIPKLYQVTIYEVLNLNSI